MIIIITKNLVVGKKISIKSKCLLAPVFLPQIHPYIYLTLPIYKITNSMFYLLFTFRKKVLI